MYVCNIMHVCMHVVYRSMRYHMFHIEQIFTELAENML